MSKFDFTQRSSANVISFEFFIFFKFIFYRIFLSAETIMKIIFNYMIF